MVTRITRTGSLDTGYCQCSLLQGRDHHEKSLLVDEAGVSQFAACLHLEFQLIPSCSEWLHFFSQLHTLARQTRSFSPPNNGIFMSPVQVFYPQNLQVGPFSALGKQNSPSKQDSVLFHFYKMIESVMLTLIPVR